MAELAIKGKVVKILPETSGTSQAGKDWVKQDFVIETADQYPKKIYFTAFGEKIVPVVKTLTVGQEVEVHFNAESREYQDKYFTQLNCWRIDKNPNGITNTSPPVISEQPKVDDPDIPF
jgi:predicted SnoaL-like aldol condensation-catalyzing enzyme